MDRLLGLKTQKQKLIAVLVLHQDILAIALDCEVLGGDLLRSIQSWNAKLHLGLRDDATLGGLDLERKLLDTMTKHLVRKLRRVLENLDILEDDRRDPGQNDAAKSIRKGSRHILDLKGHTVARLAGIQKSRHGSTLSHYVVFSSVFSGFPTTNEPAYIVLQQSLCGVSPSHADLGHHAEVLTGQCGVH